jgi:hypothetical protein
MNMAGEIQRLMDASHKADDIVKFDRMLRLLPLCGALARHPQHLEMIVAGGKCSLASVILKLVVYAMSPAICRCLADSCAELKGRSTLQEEIHAFADDQPNAFTILRRVSVLFFDIPSHVKSLRPASCAPTFMLTNVIFLTDLRCPTRVRDPR